MEKLTMPTDLLSAYQTADVSAIDPTAALEKIYGEKLEMMSVAVGRTYTRYEYAVPSGITKYAEITECKSVLEEFCDAMPIRVMPVSGKRAFCVEIPNPVRNIVGLRELVESREFGATRSIAFPVGMDVYGGTVACELKKTGSVFVCGCTGSGKDEFLNGVILGLAYNSTPDALRFVLIDTRGTEFSAYAHMPHLLFDGVVTDKREAFETLNAMEAETEARYKSFSEHGCRDIDEYTEKTGECLPRIVVVINELGGFLTETYSKNFYDCLISLVTRARAAGIHVFAGTNMPNRDVCPSSFTSNFMTKVIFRVVGEIDSRVICNEPDGAYLKGNGDMLFYSPQFCDALRLQGAYVSYADAESVADYARKHFKSDFYEHKLVPSIADQKSFYYTMGEMDPLFPRVMAVAIRDGNFGASMIQRRFSIGYARAARMVEYACECCYVEGNSRAGYTVLLTAEQYRNIFGYDPE